MKLASLLEMEVLATAKKYNSSIVTENHLMITCYEFLLGENRITPGDDLDAFFSNVVKLEKLKETENFEVPSIPQEIHVQISACINEQDVYDLLLNFFMIDSSTKPTTKPSITYLPQDKKIEQNKKQSGFHLPLGNETLFLPKIIGDKNLSMQAILPYLESDERYVWDGPYNTADLEIVTRSGQSQGRLFVTSNRLLFWSDDTRKPHVGLNYQDIVKWKTSWMPLRNRGVALHTGLSKVIFIANSTAVKHAEYQLFAKRGRF